MKNIISDVDCDRVAVASVAGSTSVSSLSCDDKFEEDGEATGELGDCFISPLANESIITKLDFIKKHPVQPSLSDGIILPFDSTRTFCRTMPNGDLVQRKWLSYNVKK